MHGAGGSLHDTAPSLGGLDICRVAAAPIGGPVAAVAAVAAAAAADSMTLSRQVRAVPLLHSLTMSKRGRKAAVPAPAPVPANTTLRQPTAQETATSAAAAESKATGGKLAAKLPSKTAAVAIGGGASSRGGLWARVAPGEGVGRHNSVEVRSLSFNSQTSLPPRNAASSEPEATSRPLASLTRVDAALFWNSEASSPQTCSFAAAAAATTTTTTTSHSSSYSPFSRAGTLSRLHSLLPQPLPLPPSTSSDLVILPAKQMKTGGGGVPREPGGEMGNGAGGVTGEGSGDDEYDGDALISRTSPVRTRGLLQLSPAAVASPLLAAVASPSDRSLTSWSGAAPPLPRGPTSFPSSPALLPNPEAPPSSPLTRNPVAAAVAPQAATGPQLAPLRLQPAMGTATATSTDVPAPSSPTLGSPTTTYSRSGINVNELVGRAAAAATGGSGPFNSQAQAARLNGLASMARVLLSVPGSPSAARRECVLQHQISSISDVNGGFGAVNSPVVAPSACRSLRLEAEDPPLSVLHAARRSVPTSRTSLSLGALPFAAAAAAAAATQYPQNPQQPPNGSPARQRLPYSSIRAMAATDLAEEYGTSRFIIDPIAGLPDAASLGRQGSGLQLRSSASGAQTRVILPELRTTIMVAAAAAAQAAPSATADAVASPLRKGEEQLPTAAAAGAATTAPAGSAEGRLLPCIPPAPAAPFFVRCVDTSSSRNSSGSSSSSRVA
ncbi:hypothetical protein Vafri_4375 [Volvox africanus]|nr:hypothetical protein Vafri_4375 [Volvox africanus]